MYSVMQNKNKNKSNSQSIKKQRLKPQWTTDFVDREQFKLTEVERIQKKASLQSKNREQARRQLQQRRKKLQMGIIDDQTRKIYETALISKNIDINPPLRRNLTEMIRYEKQQKQKMTADEENYNGSDNEEDINENQQSMKELKEAQNFIKKFQKAKKQYKIERAVQILSSNKSLEKQRKILAKEPQTKMNNFFIAPNQEKSKTNQSSNHNSKASIKSQSFSQDDALSSIEDTIRFMEEKLFAAKRTVDEHSKSFISDVNESFGNESANDFRSEQKETVMPSKPVFKKAQRLDKEINQIKFKTQDNFAYRGELQFEDKIGEISQLKIKFKDSDGESSDNECLDTIRRMRELMENKQSDYENYENKKMKQNIRGNFTPGAGSLGFNSTISKRSYNSGNDSEAEVSFNLTINEDQLQQQNSIFNITKSKFKSSEIVFSKNQPSQNFNKIKDKKLIKKKSKEDEYEEEYQKIKQNLFSCIQSNNEEVIEIKQQQNFEQMDSKSKLPFKKLDDNSDEEEQSEDSLMVQDKINMWKKELEHQVDPDEEEDDGQNILFKTTAFTIKTKENHTKTLINKQQDENEQEDDDDDESYKYNYLSQPQSQNTNWLNSKNFQQQHLTKQTNNDSHLSKVNSMKKPPMAKKSLNSEKFQEMKKMISNASTEIHKIQIQPLKIQSLNGGQVLGFDFRDSINIKKNILYK